MMIFPISPPFYTYWEKLIGLKCLLAWKIDFGTGIAKCTVNVNY
jgi:hypothetical protein